MKKIISGIMFLFFTYSLVFAQGYQLGDKAEDFKLKNVDGKMIGMSDYKDAKGYIIVFTCNHCPYAVMYEKRIIELHKKYSKKGYPVIAINPNDPEVVPEDDEKIIQKEKVSLCVFI
jgi:glutathione peroxidase-family protein